MERFNDKNVFLTGAIGGLGAEWIKVFAEEGANLAINHIDTEEFHEKGKTVVDELTQKYGKKYICYAADVTNEEEVSGMVDRIIKDFGNIDVLICGAGIMKTAVSWKTPLDMWKRTLDINLTGTFLCTKYVIPHMRAQKSGRIVYLSSVGGLSGVSANSAYCATKAGIIGFMKSVAREVAPIGITANCVAPGFISAGMMDGVPKDVVDNNLLPFIPMARMGHADEVAKAIAFLASDDANYITGEVLRVDGGYSM
ncbi:MAG: SDR family NAD(P)-dependent oxidoreductase [Lachnospiraceae bacterium]|jgi:3-oxoacyl-[acyl-carrier protein] reductase